MYVRMRRGLIALACVAGYVLFNLAISDEVSIWIRRRKRRNFYEPFNR